MLDLTGEVMRLAGITGLVLMVPWFCFLLASMVGRQLRRWGFNHSWGADE